MLRLLQKYMSRQSSMFNIRLLVLCESKLALIIQCYCHIITHFNIDVNTFKYIIC